MSNVEGAEPTIRTYSGGSFNFMWPTPKMVDVLDISHALSQVCRFAGQSRSFYSVAQHSVLVSMLVEGDRGLQFCGLLHDASEAYIGDITRPLKKHLTEYREIEERVMYAIAQRFHIPWPMPKEVKVADNKALAFEGARFMGGSDADFGEVPHSIGREASSLIARGLSPEESKRLFMERFEALHG